MNKLCGVVLAVLLVCAVFAGEASAAGFRLPEQDSAAMGMASAFVGQADNASAAWYNPAGMTDLDGTRISGGFVGIYPVLTHETGGTTEVSKRDIHIPVHFFATQKMNDNLAWGLAITNPFGLATDWDEGSSTRYVATYSKVVSLEINPNVAYKLNDNISVAFGAAYVHLRATLEKITPTSPLTDANFRLSGDGDGWGFNAALKYKLSESANLGLSYRSRVKVDIEGNAEVQGTPLSGSGNTTITLPDLIQLGVSYAVSEKLTLNADLDYTMWSTYDRVVIESNVPAFNQTDEKQWNNVWCLRIGGQYKLSDQWKVRAGYLYDKNPVDEAYFETRTPDSDRQGISVGAGYGIGNMTVDVAYMYLKFNNRTISNSLADDPSETPKAPNALNGTYKSEAHLAGVTIGYKF